MAESKSGLWQMRSHVLQLHRSRHDSLLPSCPNPLFQSEAKCAAISNENQVRFHEKHFCIRLFFFSQALSVTVI